MINIRPSEARGSDRLDWLDSRHTFSFNRYNDPAHTHFRALRVINEDRVLPGKGFETHAHRDMEILTWVLGGALEHSDSLGNRSVIRPGDLQRMTAGTGIIHSEFNHSSYDPVHFVQIWILPSKRSLQPDYAQKTFPPNEMRGTLLPIASGRGKAKAVTVHQDVDLYAAILEADERLSYSMNRKRFGWLQVTRGGVSLNGTPLNAGDGAAISEETTVDIAAVRQTEFLMLDLA